MPWSIISVCWILMHLKLPAEGSTCSEKFTVSMEDFEKGNYPEIEKYIKSQSGGASEVEISTEIEVFPNMEFTTIAPETATASKPFEVSPQSMPPYHNCNTPAFTFNETSHKDYVQYLGVVPSLESFTACAWISPAPKKTKVSGSLFNYCMTGTSACNTILVMFQNSEILVRIQNDAVVRRSLSITSHSHFCLVRSMADNVTRYYINGIVSGSGSTGKKAPGDGILILGQDQDGSPSGNDAGSIKNDDQGFTGIIQDFYLWNRALSETKIRSIKEAGCSCPTDVTISFHSGNFKIEGKVTANFMAGC